MTAGSRRAALAARPAEDRRALVAAEIMRAVYSRLLDKMRSDRWRVFDRTLAEARGAFADLSDQELEALLAEAAAHRDEPG